MTTLAAQETRSPAQETRSPAADDDKSTASQLPVPKGYRLLIALPEVSDKTDGGLYKPETAKHIEQVGTVVGFVISMGDDAYADKDRFPNGPYCKVHDFVVFSAFSGTRLKIHDKEFRIINDDTVQAVVEDPRGIERV